MKIALDIDGPIYPWHYSIYKYFTEEKGFIGTKVEFWEYFNTFSKEKQDYYVSLPFLYSNIIPSQCVFDSLERLSSLGELFYITSRWSDDLKVATRKFFDKFEVPFKENLYFQSDKATLCRLLGIDKFVDDLPRNVASVSIVCDSYLMAVAHNTKQREGFKVVNSLQEFYEEISNV